MQGEYVIVMCAVYSLVIPMHAEVSANGVFYYC